MIKSLLPTASGLTTALLKKWGINLKGTNVAVNSTMETNVAGIYAVGDVATYPGRVPLIALGFGEAKLPLQPLCGGFFLRKI